MGFDCGQQLPIATKECWRCNCVVNYVDSEIAEDDGVNPDEPQSLTQPDAEPPVAEATPEPDSERSTYLLANKRRMHHDMWYLQSHEGMRYRIISGVAGGDPNTPYTRPWNHYNIGFPRVPVLPDWENEAERAQRASVFLTLTSMRSGTYVRATQVKQNTFGV